MDDVAGRPTLTVDLPEVERDGTSLRCGLWTVWPATGEVWFNASSLDGSLARGLREDPLGLAAVAVALHNHPDAGQVERLAELLAKVAGETRVMARQVLAAGYRPPLDDEAGYESCRLPADIPAPRIAPDLAGPCPRCGDLQVAHSPERGCAVCWLREDPGHS